MSDTADSVLAKKSDSNLHPFSVERAKSVKPRKPMELDMGEGSRLQGFKLNGSR